MLNFLIFSAWTKFVHLAPSYGKLFAACIDTLPFKAFQVMYLGSCVFLAVSKLELNSWWQRQASSSSLTLMGSLMFTPFISPKIQKQRPSRKGLNQPGIYQLTKIVFISHPYYLPFCILYVENFLLKKQSFVFLFAIRHIFFCLMMKILL